jgi:DNA topoisomerase-1
MWPTAPDNKCGCGGGTLVPKEGKRCFYATELGEIVTDKLVRHFPDIMDVKFTSHMEDELDEVEEARTGWLTVIREFWEPFSADLEKAGDEMESTKNQPVEGAGPCPQCGGPLVQRWSKHGPFLGCAKYPDCKFARPMEGDAGPAAPAGEEAGPCPECGGALVQRMSRRGPFLGCSKYPECKYTRPLAGDARPAPKLTEHKCEKCGANMMLRHNSRGEPFLGCEKYPKCRSTLPCDAEGNPQRPEPTGEVCEKCGSPMVIRTSRRGPFLACSGYPKCRNTKSLGKVKGGAEGKSPAASAAGSQAGSGATAAPRRAARAKPVETDRDCPDCGSKLVIRKGSRGPFLGCSKYPKCKHTEDVPPDMM